MDEHPGARHDPDGSVLEAEIEQFEHEARRIAAGGWRRAVTGIAVGVAVGLVARMVLPAGGAEATTDPLPRR